MFDSQKIWKKENKKNEIIKENKKNRFKVNKLFLYTLNSLNLFFSRLNNFKVHKFLINFNYIWFPFIFIFNSKIIYEKTISLIGFFFVSLILFENQTKP